MVSVVSKIHNIRIVDGYMGEFVLGPTTFSIRTKFIICVIMWGFLPERVVLHHPPPPPPHSTRHHHHHQAALARALDDLITLTSCIQAT